MTTALINDPRFLEHDTGRGHPERPERLRAVEAHLRETRLWDRFRHLAFEAAEREVIEYLHAPAYVDRLMRACRGAEPWIDTPDSAICPASESIARLAVSGAIAGVESVMQGAAANVLCLLRPPGHHAERDRSLGFCLYNNVALAAEHLVRVHCLDRVAIVDLDVHHGNGTQQLFEARSDVLFISVHEDPRAQYPGTGFAHERGVGDGLGYTINLPLPSGSGDDEVLRTLDAEVVPALEAFVPQFMLLSMGFDAAAEDPLGHLRVTTDGFAAMTRRMTDAASRLCDGRLVSVLEGGYDLEALALGLGAHGRALLEAGDQSARSA